MDYPTLMSTFMLPLTGWKEGAIGDSHRAPVWHLVCLQRHSITKWALRAVDESTEAFDQHAIQGTRIF